MQLIGGVAPLEQWQVLSASSFGRFRPLCSAEVEA
jgi:hypothetical protein